MDDSQKADEAAKLLKSKVGTRRGKLAACTRKKNEIRQMMTEGADIMEVDKKVVMLLDCADEFKSANDSVYALMDDVTEREEDQSKWYEPKADSIVALLKEVDVWKSKEREQERLQSAIGPKDSVSHVSSKMSRASSIASATKIAAAEKASLEARSRALSIIHAIEMEEATLKSKKERIQLQSQIEAVDAKLKVLSVNEDQGDAMNEYYDAGQDDNPDPTFADASSINFVPLETVPKTPLQKAVRHMHISSRVATRVSETSSHQQANSSNIPTRDHYAMLQRQKELMDLMARQQDLSLLPKREVPVFDGDPLLYQSFINAFTHLIEDKTSNCQDRLYFLEQFTLGQARDLVRSCLHMNARQGYTEARQLLHKHFGNEMIIANAYLEKALNWTLIKPEDHMSLHSYALFLRECHNAMQNLDYLDELNVASNLKLLVHKLPYKLRERWRTTVYELAKGSGRVRFKHFVDFLEIQSNILLHPVFGDIRDPLPSKSTVSETRTTDSRTPKRSSFVTTVTPAGQQAPRQLSQVTQGINTSSSTVMPSCTFCECKHAVADCIKFQSEPHDRKVEHLKRNGHCFGCLKKGHMVMNCNKKVDCQICSRKHPTLLHIDQQTSDQQSLLSTNSTTSATLNSALVSADNATGARKDCALAIVPVQVRVVNGSKTIRTYAFLDPGSSATFCTENIMHQLNAKGRKTEFVLRTLGQERPVESYELSGLQVGHLDGSVYIELPKVYTQYEIPVSKGNLLIQHDLEKWPYLKGIELDSIDANVEILIGMNVPQAMQPWQVVNSQGNGPYAVKTLLGWVVNGPLNSCSATKETGAASVTVNRISMENLKDLLISQYNNDFPEKDYEEKREMSVEDKEFMDLTTKSVTVKNGHYYLPLPFRDKDVRLPNNHDVAAQRTLSLSRRFRKDQIYAAEYKTFMENVLQKGYAEKVPQEELQGTDGHVWYIPHHGVYHKQKGKLRVVFDCSSSYKGKSLNTELLQGPDLANPLLGVLLRFRQERIAIMADIEAMYYQVRVQRQHRDFLRFLWWPQGDVNLPLEVFRMNVHLFGAVSSPSIANFALKQTAIDNSDKYSLEVLDIIKHNFYIDDCLHSVASVEKAIQLTRDLREVCNQGGFTLNKWVSNSTEVLETIPESHRAPLVKQLDLDREKPPLERALGIQWNIQKDTFTFRVAVKNRVTTRRAILSVVSSIYDPLGLLSPFILKAKQILQRLCLGKYGWDEAIPDELSRPWQKWLTEMDQLNRFEVDRCMKPEEFGDVKTAELHHFCDASELGYGTVTYLRLISNTGDIQHSFILGKSRVAPLKQMTIPRLELAAATLAAKVDRMLHTELHMELTDSTFWTDSTSVLKYIYNKTKRFHTYVANRIAVIHNLSREHQWRHVTSKDNPADDASRGLNMEQLLNSTRWLKGPSFLSRKESEWPGMPKDLGHIPMDDPEVKKEITANCLNLQINATTNLIQYYSSWKKLKRAAAWLLKLRSLLLRSSKNQVLMASKGEQQGLTVKDLEEAEKAILCYEQQRYFDSELALLRMGKPVKTTSSVWKLDPIIDDGILRVGGRIRQASMPVSLKNPIILPKNSRVSKLILHDIHQQVGHAGRNHMLSKLRQGFWLPCANSAARSIIRSCVFCRRMQAKVGEQKMADLPVDRITPDLPPFSHVGIDYFGPIEVKRGRSHVKRWGVIFTCLASRAIHLEVASMLNTDSCINAIRRFLCRRGPVLTIRTDCGTNFMCAKKELEMAASQMDHQKIQDALLTTHVQWLFNPPFAAHFGGVWERLIRLVKKVLLSVLKQQTLDDEMLQTAFCEVETILNDRPITTASGDPNDLEPLTPNHLLQLNSKPLLPPGLFKNDDLYARKRWKQVQYLANLFWKRWTTEYLTLMQERQKWAHIKRNFKENDIVVIVDPTAPRNSWPMGRVMKTLPGDKGLVRSVLVKTKANTLLRPIDKLCLVLESENSA